MILIGSMAVPSYSPGIGNEVTIKTRIEGSIQVRQASGESPSIVTRLVRREPNACVADSHSGAANAMSLSSSLALGLRSQVSASNQETDIKFNQGTHLMFVHHKKPLFPVKVGEVNPKFAQKLLEQFGGRSGEFTAMTEYFVQSFACDKPAIRDMLLDIAVEEISHLEMVGLMIEQLLRGTEREKAYEDTLFSMMGKGPQFCDSMGNAWTSNWVRSAGDIVADLKHNISAEAVRQSRLRPPGSPDGRPGLQGDADLPDDPRDFAPEDVSVGARESGRCDRGNHSSQARS